MVQVYKHLMPVEAKIFEAFLKEHGDYFERFVFDVHIGVGTIVDPSWPQNYKDAVAATSRYRIDAIGYRADEIWILEVKPDAGASAVGQLLTYKTLYLDEYPAPNKLYLAVITNQLVHDMERVFTEHGIRWFVVSVPGWI